MRHCIRCDGWKDESEFNIGVLLNGCGSSGPLYPGDHDTQDLEYQVDMMDQDTRQYDPGDAYVPDQPDDPYDIPPEFSGLLARPVPAI